MPLCTAMMSLRCEVNDCASDWYDMAILAVEGTNVDLDSTVS